MKKFSPRTLIILFFLFFSFGGSAIFSSLGSSLSTAFCQSNTNPVPEYGWHISSMDVAAQLTENGDMIVQEKIVANFEVSKHGIYRTIPLLFEPKGEGFLSKNFSEIKIQNLQITQDGEKATFETSTRQGSACPSSILAGEYNKEKFIKIGDPEKTIIGQHEYIIGYIVKNAIRDDRGIPELYWNMIGHGWKVPIDMARIRLSSKGEMGYERDKVYCYSGVYGSVGEQNCSIFLVDDETIDFSVNELQAFHGVTVLVPIKPEYTNNIIGNTTGLKDRTTEYIIAKWYYVLALLPFLYFVYIWNKDGKDPETRGIIAPRFDAPSGLSPAQAGVIVDQSADSVDIASIIISIAQKGWMKIIYKKGGLLGIGEDYIFEKTNDPKAKTLSVEELIIFGSLFSSEITSTISGAISKLISDNTKSNTIVQNSSAANINVGSVEIKGIDSIPGVRKLMENLVTSGLGSGDKNKVALSSLKNVFYPIVDEAKSKLYSWAVTSKYLKSIPGPIQGVFVPGYLLIALFWYLAISNSSPIMIGIILVSTACSFIVLFFYRFYTPEGKALQEEILGLKMYMSTAEKDRIEFHNAPEKSPDLFLKLLPYAMALGVVKIWADKFEGLNMQPPSWYVGPYTHFNAAVFANDMTRASSSFASTMTSVPSRSSGGGGGGGGFSGGGGGGGGGGSW